MGKKHAEIISLQKVARFYLQNHFLLHKTKKRNVTDAIGALCGLHSQVPLTPYLSLWNRVEDFEPKLLDDGLYSRKSLVKIWCMRGTVHVIPSADLPVYVNALKRMWFEHHGRFMQTPEWPSLERLLLPKILEALAEKPLRRKELDTKVRFMLKGRGNFDVRVFSAWGGILKVTNYYGLTVFAEPCGKESCFARLDKWLPHVDLNEISEEQARTKLLLKYLHSYGPASAEDFACWSGLLTSEANKIIEANKSRLQEVRVENSRKPFWLLKEDFKTLEKIDLQEEAEPRLLPKFDSYLLGHKNRARIIDEEFRQRVFRPVVGDVAATILINGRIAGTWTRKKTKTKLTVALAPFRKLDKKTLTELEQTVKKLGDFMNLKQTATTINK
ncbi:MAG: winged helix DNA-binding domain-containing protein [Candidatus Bathyarchaeia archaeon]|nr:winged helix DNA-binding domain-containing protein [Candidatus Bathyarchaeota archaeon A05DMB-4]MDH7595196.1 winged helix DNA-binding domain-containing protein [Candidatus Bathyarchaeota archaeon]